MSKPTEEDWKRILKAVDLIYQRPDAEPFREPVPWKALGLTDYPTIIKTPMDLGTIKTKIKKREYKTLYQVNEDIRTVWNNCMTYNADGSDFYKLAELLKRKWDERYTKIINDIGSGNPISSSSVASGGGAAAAAAAATSEDVQPSSSTTSGAATATATTTTTNADQVQTDGTATTTSTTTNNHSTKASLADKRNFAKLLYQISKEELGKVLVDVETYHPAAIKRNATEDEVVLNIDEIPSTLLAELFTYVTSVKGQKKKAPTSTKSKKAKVT